MGCFSKKGAGLARSNELRFTLRFIRVCEQLGRHHPRWAEGGYTKRGNDVLALMVWCRVQETSNAFLKQNSPLF